MEKVTYGSNSTGKENNKQGMQYKNCQNFIYFFLAINFKRI